MLYKNAKAMVRSADGNIDFLNLVTGILLGDTLSSYLFIICLNCLLRTSIDIIKEGGARGIMVIVVENGHGDTSSNPGRG